MRIFDRKAFVVALVIFFLLGAGYATRQSFLTWFGKDEAHELGGKSIVPKPLGPPTAKNIFQVSAADLPDDIKAIPQPELKTDIIFPKRYSEVYNKDLAQKINATLAILGEYRYNFYSWNSLAIYYKTLDDFEGAREIWEYLLKVSPENPIFLANLGELYKSYIKDYPKAEGFFLAALKSDPTGINVYEHLRELYKFLYKTDTSAGIDILKAGIKANKGNVGLLVMLANDYKDKNDLKNARYYFSEAIKTLRKAGDIVRAQELEKELKSLR